MNFMQPTNIYPSVWHVDSWCSNVGVAYTVRMKIVEMDSVDGNYSTFSVHKEFSFQDILSTACLHWRCPTNHSSMIHERMKVNAVTTLQSLHMGTVLYTMTAILFITCSAPILVCHLS